MNVTTLNRRVCSLADAAEILRIGPSTLEWWLEGGRPGKRVYPPVIRSEPTGDRSLTWAEFVEAGCWAAGSAEGPTAHRPVRSRAHFLGLVPSAISRMQGHKGLRKRCP